MDETHPGCEHQDQPQASDRQHDSWAERPPLAVQGIVIKEWDEHDDTEHEE
jgi:hypothetical protein